MKKSQADRVRIDSLSKKIQRLLSQGSLVGVVVVLRSLPSDIAELVLEQLPPNDRERIYDATFTGESKSTARTDNVAQLEASGRTGKGELQETLPFFPHQLISVLTTAALVTSFILILTIFSPAKLGIKADILNTSPGLKPEWYFLFFYSFFSLVPSILGVIVPIVMIVALILLPFLDRNPEVRASERKFAIFACFSLIIVLIVLSILGAYYI